MQSSVVKDESEADVMGGKLEGSVPLRLEE
jgi:hypothetical protein